MEGDNHLSGRIKLYKYKPLHDLWHVLDIIINRRIFCAHWSNLNDPLEGRYEIFLGKNSPKVESIMTNRIDEARDSYRIASLSADPFNFLLWSHYANGHKGVAVEIEMPLDHEDLFEIEYTEFSSVFSEKGQTTGDMRHIFNGKSLEWSYEKEYRILKQGGQYFDLPIAPHRILLGPMIDEQHETILQSILRDRVELVKTTIDQNRHPLTVTEISISR